MGRINLVLFSLILCVSTFVTVHCEDPYLFFTWNVTYATLSPLGVPQQVILINGQFPGPRINCTSNNNIVVNVFNNLNEPFLLTWNGIQQRKNSWQEGTLGTTCPIPPGKNFTYHFQVKDQIGSFFYHATTALHHAAGAYGPIRVHSRDLIPVPFDRPEDEYDVLVGDWYTKGHSTLKKLLDSGRTLARADGVLINGKAGSTKGENEPMFTMIPGKTYRYRFCNVGMKNSINVRIQGHTMKLVEIEGSHTVQNVYDSLDVHLGQCYSVLVTANQEPNAYYLVASTRFTKTALTSTATISYSGSTGPASPELPEGPVGWSWSLNQFKSFRWNLTASAARPNPQGSYHYGQINITRTIKLVNSAGKVDGKLRYAINGISHVNTETPLKLAEYFGVAGKVFKYDLLKDEPPTDTKQITIAPNVINATFRNFVEIIFENHEKSVQSWHLAGYAFFAVAIEPGKWTPDKRKNYNLLDAISRNTIQVYPKSWAAIMTTLDNAGMWILRSMISERQYLGQQLYISVLSPARSLQDEYNIPDDDLLCGIVKDQPMPEPYTA
ncbi:L-ascorbate oxidase homolog [Olea europaea var. sylvestris]|uniref:L-ascorbate oxidase homolog n=1 Tax=Olea europaea var. sylvestris TaxID=158386 RepID=UPI000C1CF35E|nr:L-ascorbate oxidase homolog [Olea europaea var. sylvestris]